MTENNEENTRLNIKTKCEDGIVSTISHIPTDLVEYFFNKLLKIDPTQRYETAVMTPRAANGNWINVETYTTWEDALAGHKKWVDKFKVLESIGHLHNIITDETYEIKYWKKERDEN